MQKYEIAGFTLPDFFEQGAEQFTKILLFYNKTHNITGAKDSQSIRENIYDSIYPLQFLKNNPKSAIDIGSGGGFPAVILALAMPSCHFALYEPLAKKSAFLHLLKSELNLSNIDVKTKRVEEDTPKPVELITSRAVCETALLIKLSKGFYDKNTIMLLYKGQRANEEILNLNNAQIFTRQKRKYIFIKGLDSAV
ncbi:MAG: 16S rRNA (guanine(527)-N(7))-methyltransferase RsmG [Campylobacteraceae bacterium]|jgi:16S rRNA (guanine527-N7)-methyltransferase|nr:16S rRNA (guanine(527)-N(7))-methyltransferase RsmG [Campylobacteraceae bacterium]